MLATTSQVPTLIIVSTGLIVAIAQLIFGITAWYNARAAHSEAKAANTVVQGNGKGDVSVMMESLLTRFDTHEQKDDQRFAAVDAKLKGSSLDQPEQGE